MDQMLFHKRYEAKYLMDTHQQAQILAAMSSHMVEDQYGHDSIRNLYLDTPDYRLIRRSLERPVYKEKFRIRSYGRAAKNQQVYMEQKKKYKSIVYKRRISIRQDKVLACVYGLEPWPDCQIGSELAYAANFYKDLHPSVFLSYDRDAYRSIEGDGVRITFDYDIRYRQNELTLDSEPWGKELLRPDQVLMEVKVAGGFPLWLTSALSEQKLYKTSFSKYGMAYREIDRNRKESQYA